MSDLGRQLDELLDLHGDERVLDVGAGTGALAFALSSRVESVVGVDTDEERIERAREAAPPNVELRVADAEQLPFAAFSFDLAASRGMLHHTARPDVALAELARVTRSGGTVLVIDRLAPVDPLAALELNRVERAREPSITRLLSDGDLRALFDVNGLVLRRDKIADDGLGWYVLARP
ncbi:MAG TPA: methyltransferase domain-containing protein [Gaiellaceae bacterium]